MSSKPSSLKTKLKETALNKRTKNIAFSAIIASLYVILTGISALFGLDKGLIQLRLSEMLCVLPFLTQSGIYGVFFGCLLSGILFGAMPLDTVFGSLTTLSAAVITYYMPKTKPYLAPLPPILLNTLVIPFILKYVYGIGHALPVFALTVFIGEMITCGIFGALMLKALPKSITDMLK